MNTPNLSANALWSQLVKVKSVNGRDVFFPELLRLVNTVTQLKHAIDVIVAKELKIKNYMNDRASDALNEIKLRVDKIKAYFDINGLYTPEIKSLMIILDGKIKVDYYDETMSSILMRVFELMLESDIHDDFLKSFEPIHSINDYKFMRREEVLPKCTTFDRESLYFIQARQTASWFSLNQLIVFRQLYDWHYFDTLLDGMKQSGQDTTQPQEEHNAMIEYAHYGIIKKPNQFPSIEEYKIHAERLVEEIISIIDSGEDATKFNVSYIAKKGTLTINTKSTTFKTDSASHLVLKLLIPKKGPSKREWSHEAIYEKIASKLDHAKKKLDLYEVGRSINNHIANKIGIPDFLILQGAKIKINPSYLC